MTLEEIGIYATAICMLIGSGFVLVGVIGLLKFNHPMTRLHAPTKVGTMGIGMLLLASVIHSFSLGDVSFHELLIMGFLFVTAPVSANFIAKVHIHSQSFKGIPKPPRDETWSTLSTAQAEPEMDDEYRE